MQIQSAAAHRRAENGSIIVIIADNKNKNKNKKKEEPRSAVLSCELRVNVACAAQRCSDD